LGCLHLRDEADCNASGYWPTCQDAALLNKLFCPGDCREDNSFDKGAGGFVAMQLTCFGMVKFNEEFHFDILSFGAGEWRQLSGERYSTKAKLIASNISLFLVDVNDTGWMFHVSVNHISVERGTKNHSEIRNKTVNY
jgi:hypothetical protein